MKLSVEQINKIAERITPFSVTDRETYLLENEIDQLRICDDCGRILEEGYCINSGEEHYCTTCLHKHYSEEEYLEMSSSDNAESYYTIWNE